MDIDSYIYEESLYHRLDARPKLVFTILMVIFPFFVSTLPAITVYALIPVFISLFSLGLRETWRNIRRVLPVFILMFLFMPFQSRSSEALIVINGFKLVTEEGFYEVYMIAMRFMSVALMLECLLETARNSEIVKALRFFHMPYKAALSLSMILRFIPHLGSLFTEIRDSMSLRLSEGKRGYPVIPSVTALTVAAIRMIPESASVLEERGFGRKHTEQPFPKPESYYIEMALCAIIPVILFILLK